MNRISYNELFCKLFFSLFALMDSIYGWMNAFQK
jgi:hypothetical protein